FSVILDLLKDLLTWFPAIILPGSTMIQIVKIVKSQKSEGVSWLSWFLFGIANIGAYFLAQNYFSIKVILAFILTAILDFIIVLLVFTYRKK
ncbi:MAG TPA: hypothetical protein QGH56_07275, partial [Candidatus Marinimicrobia bacterium]|nr:hypothetical protein [Candidatus Neomarinimicrobiota bacterium]